MTTTALPASIDVHIPQGCGGLVRQWRALCVGALETLKPNEFVPGRVNRQLGIPDCERLLRRYKLARRLHDGGFRNHDMTKRVDYLGGPPETWRVDLPRLLRMLNEAGPDLGGLHPKFGAEPLPVMRPPCQWAS